MSDLDKFIEVMEALEKARARRDGLSYNFTEDEKRKVIESVGKLSEVSLKYLIACYEEETRLIEKEISERNWK